MKVVAPAGAVLRTRFGRGYGTAARQTANLIRRLQFTPSKGYKPRHVMQFEILKELTFGMVGLYAIGMIFNAGSSDAGKVGYTTRFIVNKRHY